MKINEFVEKINKEDVDLNTILEIRTYIPIAEKRAILETILDKCFTVEDGVLTCDYILMKMTFELAMIKYHTNLEIDITSEGDYDELQKIGIDFHDNYLADYNECQILFDGMRRELCSQYSIESSIARLSNQLSDGIENFVKTITQKVDGFDMSKFGFEGKELDQLKNLLNKYGK